MAKLEPEMGQLGVGVRAEDGTWFTRAPFRGGFDELPRGEIPQRASCRVCGVTT